MKTIRFDHLQKIAQHLQTGKLGHKEFDFRTYNSAETKTCGTAGCAIGECPIVFSEWHFSETGEPCLKKDPNQKPYTSGREFFGLNVKQFDHLFCPFMQKPEFGGIELNADATKEQVAGNILAFCEAMKTVGN